MEGVSWCEQLCAGSFGAGWRRWICPVVKRTLVFGCSEEGGAAVSEESERCWVYREGRMEAVEVEMRATGY